MFNDKRPAPDQIAFRWTCAITIAPMNTKAFLFFAAIGLGLGAAFIRPTGAPNAVIVLIDDIGFGASSAFGGPIGMPTLDKLATGFPGNTGIHPWEITTQAQILRSNGFSMAAFGKSTSPACRAPSLARS